MIELSRSALIARYSSLSFPMISSCPTTSSNVCGLILAASGDSFSLLFCAAYSKRSIMFLVLNFYFPCFVFYISRLSVLSFYALYFQVYCLL